uniref:CCDC50_N domain-containing protein n=1 Tax=Angiostrongylus cantonensis TaxID=6313 RepID=A0A0K0D1I7_ANGCA
MDKNRSIAEVRQRLREIEDQSIASRLQEEEFNKYYNHNRQYRHVVEEDTKRSIREQANEDEFAHRKRIDNSEDSRTR